jgi:hypothetical protein
MNNRTFHRNTIRGLLRHTINRTHLDLERRGLVNLGIVIDWNNLRTLNQEIDRLFNHPVQSTRERTTVGNIIIEVRLRVAHFTQALPNYGDFEQALFNGIKVYSRYIKANPQITGQPIYQSLEDQFHWGILENYQRGFQVNKRVTRYLKFELEIATNLVVFCTHNGINPNFNTAQTALTTLENLSWCLSSYQVDRPLYRTILREYLEEYYLTFQLELQSQQINIDITPFVQQTEQYINQQCTYLEFNIENEAATLIQNFYRLRLHQQRNHRLQMNAQDLRNVLNAVLGQNGLDIAGLAQQLQNAVPQPAGVRELSIIKLPDFSGKPEEDPHEWVDLFEQAATANRWAGDDRLLAICKGYLKGAALDWAIAETAATAANQIVRWDAGNNANHVDTSMKQRFLEKFAPEAKRNQWYYDLMTIRQKVDEKVDSYTLRFQRLLRKVNVNQLIPAALQIKMYLYGLSPILAPMVVMSNPADLQAAIDRHLVQTIKK